MRKRAVVFLSLALVAVMVAVPMASAGPGKRELLAALSGQEEVPKPGDPTATGPPCST